MIRFVLDLNRNLILMGNLDYMKLQVKLGNGILKIFSGSFAIFKCIKRNGIFVTKHKAIINHTVKASTVEIDATLKLLNRLVHVSDRCLQILHKL